MIVLLWMFCAWICFVYWIRIHKTRWRILIALATSLFIGIVYMLIEDEFCWYSFLSFGGNLGRNLGGIFGYAMGAGAPLWIFMAIVLISGGAKTVKIKKAVKNEKDKFYAIAFDEVSNDHFDKVTLAKVMAANNPKDSIQIKNAYLKYRVAQLEKEFIDKQKKEK
jgi:uncharacterized membrane protein required for colicin V production